MTAAWKAVNDPVMRIVPPADKTTLPLALITSDEAKAILKTSRFRFGTLDADVFLQGHFVEQGFEVRLSDDTPALISQSLGELPAMTTRRSVALDVPSK